MTAEEIRNKQDTLNKEANKIAEEILYTERQTVISGISASMDKKIAETTDQYINVRLESSQFKTKLDVLYKSIEERLNELGFDVRIVSDDRWSTIIFVVDWSEQEQNLINNIKRPQFLIHIDTVDVLTVLIIIGLLLYFYFS